MFPAAAPGAILAVTVLAGRPVLAPARRRRCRPSKEAAMDPSAGAAHPRLSHRLTATVYAASSAVALTPAVASAAPPAPAAPAAAVAPAAVAPGTFLGHGFDACAAPSSAAMHAWLASPYRAVGIYFGGNNRACPQPNLTAAWVTEQQAAGWHLMPIYLGLQASCTTSNKHNLITNSQAAAQGRTAADDAATQAAAIGLTRGSMLIFDMEAYRTDDAACRAGVLAFLSAWTARLHDHAYLSGVYGSMSSTVADLVANYGTAGFSSPDYLDFARWDGVDTVDHPDIPDAYWSPHRRIKQYLGGHNETWGGVTINIDNDYLDVAPLPATPFGDFNGNGWSDVLARTSSTGNLYFYPGNGVAAVESGRVWFGGGWGAMNAIVRIGDLNRDGREDLVARQASNGDLWFYPGAGTGFGARKKIGVGWNSVREITGIGDVNRDGYPDVLANRTADQRLYLYPGKAGAALGTRVAVTGTGWNGMSELTGVGDFDANGHPDLVARSTSTGTLYLYPGLGTGFAARKQIGTGWGGFRDLVGVGDFDRDGRTDLVAVQKSTGNLFLYRGTGTGLRPRLQLATGYGGRAPVA
jgi:hypothetical protein